MITDTWRGADDCRMNIVTWTLGRVGKGSVFPDGHVRAWSGNHGEQPHHADVEHPPGSIRFRISPDGAVEVFGPSWAQDVAVAAVRTSPTTNRS